MALAFDSAGVLAIARLRLPAGWSRIGGFAELGSEAVSLSIAVVTILRFMEALG
jgi:hypothetical protein